MNAKTAAIGAIRSLIKNNILCDVVGMQSPDKFKCIVPPMLTDAEPDSHALIDYVCAGNTVYLSGVEDIDLFETLTKGKYLGRTEENKVYIAPTKENEDLFLGFNNKYPLMWDGTAAVVKASPDTEILAYIKLPYTKPNDTDFASIHSNPPGKDTDIPAVTVNRFGKGTVIWSAVPIEAGEAEEYGIGTFVYYRREPLNMGRFDEFVARKMPKNVIRVKGICYFQSDYDMCYIFEQAGKQIQLREVGQWFATMPPYELKQMMANNPDLRRDWDDRYGDRMQKLVFIGQHIDKEAITKDLDECLVK